MKTRCITAENSESCKTDEMEYNIKNIKEEFKAKGIFYTQPELAKYIMSLVDIEITDVYDPTCGDGGLLACFPDDLPKYGQEINDHQLAVANERLVNFTGYCGDTLKDPAFMHKRFSCIVANPPFSIKWDPPVGMFKDARFADVPALPPPSKADYAFLLHIVHLLKHDGIAIVLNFPGILYRGNSEGIIRKWFVEQNLIEKVIAIPGKTFVDTTIATALLVIKKNKVGTDIEFIDNEIKLSRTVSAEEVAKNDYTLSVSTYVQPEVKKQVVDADALQQLARQQTLSKLKADIEMDKMICELEGWDFKAYVNQLHTLLQSYF